MDYTCACIDGKSYGEEKTMIKEEISRQPQVTNVDFRDKRLFEALNNNDEKVM